MFQKIKDFIKTKPRLYDLFNERRPLAEELEIWIDDFSKTQKRAINFIQVGASDGLRWDPVRRFIIRDKWNGVLIEPLEPVYNMLVNNYAYVKQNNLKFENCAISKEKGHDIRKYSERKASKKLNKHKKEIITKLKTSDRFIKLDDLFKDMLLETLWGTAYPKQSPKTGDIITRFYRHKIMHGEYVSYGSIYNVLRAFFLLDFISELE